MEDEPSLETWLEERGSPHRSDALAQFRGIVYQLGIAHRAGFVHGDLDLSRIRVAGTGSARIADFEPIASVDGAPVAADLRALGRVLHALVGTAPEDDRLASVIRDLGAADPEQRITSCPELWARLWDEPVPPELRAVPLAVESALDAPMPLAARAGAVERVEPRADPAPRSPTFVDLLAVGAAFVGAGAEDGSGEGPPLWVWPAALAAALGVVAVPFGLVLLYSVA